MSTKRLTETDLLRTQFERALNELQPTTKAAILMCFDIAAGERRLRKLKEEYKNREVTQS